MGSGAAGRGAGDGLAELLALADGVVARARAGEQVEAFVVRGRSTSVRVYQREVEAFTRAEQMGVGVRVVVSGRQGFAHVGSFDADAVTDALSEARENARFAEPDQDVGLAEPDGVDPPVLDTWAEAAARLPEADKIDLALDLEDRVLGADPRIVSVRAAAFGDALGEVAVVSTTGIRAVERAARCSLSVSAVARDGDDATSGWAADAARRPDELDRDRVAADAVERAVRMLGASKPPSQRVTVVLEPRLAASLVGVVAGMLSGERLVKGRTPFRDRVGEVVASPRFTLVDDATDARSLGAEAYDGEGLASRPTPLVAAGVLEGFLHSTYTARRAGAAPTASAVRSHRTTPGVGARVLVVEPGPVPTADLLTGVDDGLWVASMSGLHSGVNAVSGDFSVGVEGLRIRGGELAEPIREATLASTVQRLLSGIAAVGAELEWLPGGSAMATLVIADVALSGR